MLIAQNEAEMIRLTRIVEEEEEKLRVQRISNEEQERLRLVRIKEEELIRLKLIQTEEVEHINKIKILSQSYEVEILMEESKLEWLRQDWGTGRKIDGTNDDIMKNLLKQLEEAEKARNEAEDMKQQEWERAKVMI
jgi:prolactin regulatory element-binding protein